MATRSRKNNIVILSNFLTGKIIDTTSRTDGDTIIYDQVNDRYIHKNMKEEVTFETLSENGDVGPEPNQLATGDHDHEIGDMATFFENKLV